MQRIHINTNDGAIFDVKMTFNKDGNDINTLIHDIFNQYVIENNTENLIYLNKLNNNMLL